MGDYKAPQHDLQYKSKYLGSTGRGIKFWWLWSQGHSWAWT